MDTGSPGAGSCRLEVHVLGPVEIQCEGQTLLVERAQERALLARLALARGAAVSDEALQRDLWRDGVDVPVQRLRVLASRVRASLGEHARALERTRAGYRLAGSPVDLDTVQDAADRLSAAATAGAGALIASRALALWRGPALADLRSTPFAATEADRLDALWLTLRIEQLSAESAIGGHDVVAPLERLAGEHPLDERVGCLLALALYRAGRQAAALARIGQLRHELREQIGVDPSADTAQLELQILRHDPDLHARPEPRAREFGGPWWRAGAGPIVGRDVELSALLERLALAGLTTLTGGPGAGKTRLALETARVVRDSGRAVAWLDLASRNGQEAVLAGLCDVVDVDSGAANCLAQVAAELGPALLVVDNAEHLVAQAAEVLKRLLAEGAGLTVLVTSQTALLLAGEEVRFVGALPPTAAGELFCRLSGAEHGPDVERICAAVDGLPLAVELAAGLTRALSVRQLAERIDDRLRLLVGGQRDQGARHASLRGSLEWSYDLLDDRARAVLRRLAVFSGGCTLEAAEAVLADEVVSTAEVAPLLAELVSRCLLTVGGEPEARRLFLLETIRDFGAERLRDGGEDDVVRARHVAWCAEHLRSSRALDDELEEARAIAPERPNVTAALDNAIGCGQATTGLRLAIAMDDFWLVRGMHQQAARYYAILVAAASEATDTERAHAMSNHAYACIMLGRLTEAVALLDAAESVCDRTDDAEVRMRILYHRGICELQEGWPARALDPLRRGYRVADSLGRRRSLTSFLDVIATARMHLGDVTGAREQFQEVEERERELGAVHASARGHINLVPALLADGERGLALKHIEAAEILAKDLDDAVVLAHMRWQRGRVAAMDGDFAAAIAWFNDALGISDEDLDAALIKVDLAAALIDSGRTDEAATLLETVGGGPNGGLPWLVAQPVLASLALARGNRARGAELVDRSRAEYADRAFAWPPAVSHLRAATERLSSPTRSA